MFYLLAVCVCLGVLFLVAACASLVCLPLRRLLRPIILRMANSGSPALAANVLFALRTLPLFLALGITLGFALPAFLEFEPRASGEGMSGKLALLAAAGAVMTFVFTLRGARALRATSQAEGRWRAGAEEQLKEVSGSRVRLYCVGSDSALLAVTGFFRSRVFIGSDVARTLSSRELAAALDHELAHVSFFDNLRQLLMKVTRLPSWLERTTEEDAAWLHASELAADQAALARGASAVELASALVKVSRLKRAVAAPGLVAASHLLPDSLASTLEWRVTRLQRVLEGEEGRAEIGSGGKPWRSLCVAAASLVVYAVAVNTFLPAMHRALEFLVR